jgi:hypothetical protein
MQPSNDRPELKDKRRKKIARIAMEVNRSAA